MTHEHPIRVYYEDTDAGGVAYHASYLRWAERARTESLRDLGLPHSAMQQNHGCFLVVKRLSVEYARPARLATAGPRGSIAPTWAACAPGHDRPRPSAGQ